MKSIRRILVLFLIIFCCIFIPRNYAKSEPTFYIEDGVKYQNSEEVSVNIFMKNVNTNIVAFSLSLKYDIDKLEFINAKAGKDLKATMKLAEDFPEESRVGMGAVSLSGFEQDGLYYTLLFKVKDDENKNIPLELVLKECTDKNGDDIECKTEDGKIVFSKDEININVSEIEKIPAFETVVSNQLETLEEIIADNTGAQFSINDVISYECLSEDILKVSNDGTMIPKSNGKAIVKINKGDIQIAEVEITVEDGKIETIKSLEEFTDSITGEIVSDTKLGIDKSTYRNSSAPENTITKNETDNSKNVILGIVIVLVIIVLIIIKYKKQIRGGKK